VTGQILVNFGYAGFFFVLDLEAGIEKNLTDYGRAS